MMLPYRPTKYTLNKYFVLLKNTPNHILYIIISNYFDNLISPFIYLKTSLTSLQDPKRVFPIQVIKT